MSNTYIHKPYPLRYRFKCYFFLKIGNTNSNRYRSMYMDLMRMNQDDVDEEPNADATSFLIF